MSTPLGDAIQFFKDFGLFDVVLPFLLVFTLMFALLEKTKVLGTEPGSKDMPRRSLNLMVSFVVGLLVVATNKVVTIINTALPNVVLILVAIVMFLMLAGTFFKTGEFDFAGKYSRWVIGFMIVILLLIVLIFVGSYTLDSGDTILESLLSSSGGSGSGSIIGASVLFVVIAGGAAAIIMKKPSGGDKP